jgi:translation initiation factor IF-3
MTNINRDIRAKEVRVISSEGQQMGIVPLEEALRIAEEDGLDLVEVAPTADPPVCRIMDYGKYRYQQIKKMKDAKKKQTVVQLKEVKLSPKTEDHDLQYKIDHIRRFLKEGNRAKITISFRGREIDHPDIAHRVIDRIVGDLKGLGIVDQAPKLEGRRMTLILRPDPHAKA